MIWWGGTLPLVVKGSFCLQQSYCLFFNARERESIHGSRRSERTTTAMHRKEMENAWGHIDALCLSPSCILSPWCHLVCVARFAVLSQAVHLITKVHNLKHHHEAEQVFVQEWPIGICLSWFHSECAFKAVSTGQTKETLEDQLM